MLLVKQLDRPRIPVEGRNRYWVVLKAHDTGPLGMRLNLDADLLRNEVADALAATSAALEAFGIDLQPSPFEPLLVGTVILMQVDIDVAITARVEGVLMEVADEAHVHLGHADAQQEVEIMPAKILYLVDEENVEVLFQASHHRSNQAGLLDELGETVRIEPAAWRHVAPVIGQRVDRKPVGSVESDPECVLLGA
ncbi:hypothetical protein D3C85_1068510 [compost metagenome]